jgi:hypothetical protein
MAQFIQLLLVSPPIKMILQQGCQSDQFYEELIFFSVLLQFLRGICGSFYFNAQKQEEKDCTKNFFHGTDCNIVMRMRNIENLRFFHKKHKYV